MDDQYFSPTTSASQTWLRSPTTPTYVNTASPTSSMSGTWPSPTAAASPTSPTFAASPSRMRFDYTPASGAGSTSSTSLSSFGPLSSLGSSSNSSAPLNTSSGSHPYTPISPTFPSSYPFVAPQSQSPMLSPQKEARTGPIRALTRRQRAALQQTVGSTSELSVPRPTIRSATASSSRLPSIQTQQQSKTPTPSDTSSSLRSASPALSASSSLTSISSGASPFHGSSSPFPSPTHFSTPATQFTSPISQSRAKSRKQRLFNIDRKEICKYAAEHPNSRQEDIATRFGVERSTISKILKNKARWLNVPSDEEMRIAKHRPSKFPEIEEELVRWLLDLQEKQQSMPQSADLPYNAQGRIPLTDSLIRNQAKSVAKRLGVPEDKFKASSGWVENFKHRHGIRGGVWRGDGKNTRAARAMGFAGKGMTGNYSSSMAIDDRPELPHSPTLEPYEPEAHTPVDLQPALPSPVDPPVNSPFDQPSYNDDTSSAFNSHSTAFTTTQSTYSPYQDTSYPNNGYPSSAQYTEAFPQPATSADMITHAEAEASLNRLLAYVDTTGQNIITDEERAVLDRVKRAMFQAASGIPYIRPGSG